MYWNYSSTSSDPRMHCRSGKSLWTLLMLTKFGDVCFTPHNVGIFSCASAKKSDTPTTTQDIQDTG